MVRNIYTVAKKGGQVAKVAREQLESQLGHSIISPSNVQGRIGQPEPPEEIE